MTVFFADIVQSLVTYFPGSPQPVQDAFDSAIQKAVLEMVLLGVGNAIVSYLQMTFFLISGENQSKRIRELYLKAILRQDVGWFDKTSTGELVTRINGDTNVIQDGISDKVGLIIQFTASFIAGFVIGFIKGWKLALVLCSVFPLLSGAAFLMAKVLSGGSTDEQAAYASAGGVAQQVLSSMKTVVSFGGEEREIKRYSKHLDEAEKFGTKKALSNGVGVAVIQGLIFLVYALAFWYGNTLIPNEMNAGQVLNVFFAIIIGAFSLGQATPHLAAIGLATGAAHEIFETIDRVSPIDSSSTEGTKLESITGAIEFKNISFHYPSRDDVPILSDFSLDVKAGQTVALVGSSGSGKSTIVKLVERFYNPVKGSISLDGHELKSLNVKWLREQIGFVSQEPTLFDVSIRENILYGLKEDPSVYPKEKLDSMVEEAAKMANAFDFVKKLPNGFDTHVGEAGSMLSGGQKQRICIARAIIKNPSILLLDEATSALDTTSERLVQAALENVSKNRTTLVIAHRLSTIKNADRIIVMRTGTIVEAGTHQELIANNGLYNELVEAQRLNSVEATAEEPKEVVTERKESVKVEVKKTGDEPSQGTPAAAGGPKELTDAEKELVKKKFKLSRVMMINKPEFGFFVLGSLGAAINGVVMPLFSIIFSNMLKDLGTDKANFWSIMFVCLSLGAFISNFLQIGLFRYAGEKLTRRVREMVFRALLRMEMGFFDDEKNSTGALVTKLAEEATLIQGVTGIPLGAFIQAFAGLTAGLIISFMAAWQLSLVIIGLIPLIGFAGYLQIQAMTGFGQKSQEAYASAGKTVNEAIGSIRTVILLTKEDHFYNRYLQEILAPHDTTIKGAFVTSVGFATSQAIPLFAYAVSFFYGSRLIIWGLYSSVDILKCIFAIIFSAMVIGQTNQHTMDMSKAKLAAIGIFDILDRASLIDPFSESGEKKQKTEGQVDVKDAEFSYPIRPDTKILQGLNVAALPGKTIALVGGSGCGKSTVLGLLERWYDVSSGNANLDGLDVRKYNLKTLRSHMAIVGQEPVLFNVSIKENIAYGAIGEFTDADIIEAAKLANIHDFIANLPNGYETLVGEKGGLLSGGQKQRIAIARAMIRKPKVLLLDEATSALDSESERVVQTALDVAAKDRTSLIIAHRLSSIQGADRIYVIKEGKVAESGTHSELLTLKGDYYILASQQTLHNPN